MANPQGTGFINLGRILQANQNNRLGQQIGSRLAGEKSALEDERGRQQQEFNKSITSTQGKLEQDKNQQQSLINEADTNPGDVSKEDADKYASYRNYVYTGPTGLGNASELGSGAQNYQQNVDLGRTRGGRQELISRYSTPRGYNNPSYNRLDELYLGNKDLQTLKGARLGANQLQQQNVQAIQGAQGQAAQQENQAQQFRTQANQQVDARKQALLDILNQRATQAGATQEQQYQDLLGGGAFQQVQPNIGVGENASYLGLNKPVNQYNFGVGPETFVNRGTTANASTVADANERAKSQALASLAGIANPIDVNAEQFQGAGVNTDAYTQAINNALTGYKSELSNNNLASTGFKSPVVVGPNNPDPNKSLADNFQTLTNVKNDFENELKAWETRPNRYQYIDGQKVDMYQRQLDNYNNWLNDTYNPILQSGLVKGIQGRYNLG